ncbi:MAG TPA: hypothetical protein VHD62_17115 [Opitutaceae bacterium]|nr:hypothetical protein [Opitutaceae bacterium]
MKTPLLTLGRLVLCFCAAIAIASAASLTGKWTAEFDTQIGVQKYTFTFKADGDKLTGKAAFERTDQKGEVDLKDVKVDGDKVSFTEPLRFQDNEIVITYQGQLAGDELKLTRTVGEFATEQLVAKRVVDAAEKPAPKK